MELQGKVINFLGDSITEGAGTSGQSATFWKRIERDAGLKAANGYGIGGTRIARQQHPTEDRFDRDFVERAPAMDPNADAVVVFGGTNDFGHGDAPIGTFDDRTPGTFYGACHVLMSDLLTRYPGKPIVFMTPLHRLEEDNVRDGRPPLSAFVAIIKEVAAYYSLPVLDLWSVSGLQPAVPIIRERFVPDGLHPNDAGHAILAERLLGFLSSL